jgi:hypothetical protein
MIAAASRPDITQMGDRCRCRINSFDRVERHGMLSRSSAMIAQRR